MKSASDRRIVPNTLSVLPMSHPSSIAKVQIFSREMLQGEHQRLFTHGLLPTPFTAPPPQSGILRDKLKSKPPRNPRGRKGGSLKFHNFVANNNSPNGSQDTSTSSAAHCLREEHGTKQITVSHWKKCSDESSSPEMPPPSKRAAAVSLPNTSKPSSSKNGSHHSILESLLANQKAGAAEVGKVIEFEKKAHKRKPLLVRRVLREDEPCRDSVVVQHQDEPLDLSTCKKQKLDGNAIKTRAPEFRHPSSVAAVSRIRTRPAVFSQPTRHNNVEVDSVQSLIQSVEESAAHAASIIASVRGSVGPTAAAGSRSEADRARALAMYPSSRTPLHRVNEQQTRASPSLMYPHQTHTEDPFAFTDPSSQLMLQHQQAMQMLEDDQDDGSGKKDKKQNTQRSVIKQKLEDAFRQNGFLVKTKQVSDGDATFCKFRQLRKYTRYYLKSWHQHLPEEVNKLWKGFLPPKTAKPSTSQAPS